MACETCGEKPKKCGNCNKDFPRAGIEIDNPETLVLLRKVVIPASMGDDTVVLPAIGKYHNVVLYYEANKRVYIYSSDGVPTPIEAGVPQEILDKIADLEEEIDTSIGKAKVLTSADYNWNSSTQSATEPYNCVAVWLLPAGIYHKTDSSVYALTTLASLLDTDEIVIVGKPNSNNERPLLELDATVYAGGTWSWATAMVVPTSGNVAEKYYELKPPADDLTTTGMDIPLAAKQGKILNERIGDLTTLATTAKTSAVEAINETIDKSGYYTNEINTNTKWIDGSPIYKKTIDTGALPNNTTKTVQHGVGMSLKRAIKIEGYAYSTDFGINMSMPDPEIAVQVAGTGIEITTSTDLSMFAESYVTLYYTKTQ